MTKEKKKFPDGAKIFLFRWWTVGACCFLGAFGTSFGASQSPYDLLFLLSSIISAVMIFLFNPMMLMLYDVKKAGRIINQEYKKQKLSSKIFRNIREIGKCYFISFMTYITYQGVNFFIVMAQNFDENAFFIPLEPILYGLLFSFYYLLISALADKVVVLFRKKEINNNEK